MHGIILCLLILFFPAAGVAASWPAGAADFATTSADVYLGNLDARIDALDAAGRRSPRAELQVAQAGATYHRYRIRGRLQDAESALALLDAVLRDAPQHRGALKLRAAVRSGFHRFDDARADLDAALAAGDTAADQADARREIALATGRYDEAGLREALDRSAGTEGGFYELALRGNLLLQQGDLAGASRQFERAQSRFADSSPLPLAWLHVQQGIALLRHGRHAEAARFFRAAHERLPGYTLATEHLAEAETRLGHRAAARVLYARVISDTGSPEFVSALAALEREDGNVVLATRLDGEADALWSEWLSRHPSAFSQHAIGHFIERGDADRALLLARGNIARRQDVGSYVSLAEAAQAAGEPALACSARRSALATGLRPPELAELDALAEQCARIAAR